MGLRTVNLDSGEHSGKYGMWLQVSREGFDQGTIPLNGIPSIRYGIPYMIDTTAIAWFRVPYFLFSLKKKVLFVQG